MNDKLTDYIETQHFDSTLDYFDQNRNFATNLIGAKIGWMEFATAIMRALSHDQQEEVLCWICRNYGVECKTEDEREQAEKMIVKGITKEVEQ